MGEEQFYWIFLLMAKKLPFFTVGAPYEEALHRDCKQNFTQVNWQTSTSAAFPGILIIIIIIISSSIAYIQCSVRFTDNLT